MVISMIDLSFPLEELEIFLLIMTRVTAFIYIAPFFGMNNTPNRVKIGLGFFISYLLYQTLSPIEYIHYQTLVQYAVIIIKEVFTGLIIGLSAQMCLSIVSFAGKIIDMEIGLSMLNQMDPTTKEQSTITGIYYQYVVMLMLIISGMHQYLIKALVETFTLIPLNQANFHLQSFYTSFLSYLTSYVTIGFRICLPVFAVSLILNAVLGILAKTAPQLNMFAVGMQLKVLVGLVTLFFTTVMLPGISNFIFIQMKTMMKSFVEGMM